MRFLIYLFLAYVAYRIVKALLRPRKEVPPGDVVDEMVQCSSCKTYIPRRESIRKTVNGETYPFCSQECADKFTQSKEKQSG
jgi:YHS domain-containing protein